MKKKNNHSFYSRIKGFFARNDIKANAIKFFLLGAAATSLFSLAALAALSPNLPGFERLERVYDEQTLSTIFYSDDGEVLQVTSNPNKGRRMWLSYNEIPQVMIDAVIAAEDTRFYKHWGVSLPDIARAAFKNVLNLGIAEGASTITQQLARDQWLNRRQTLYRKMQEALLAVKIEHTYSKPEILELFLNRMNFGGTYNGIEAASRGYFGKPATELTITEAALLAGILQGPTRYHPRLYPEAAHNRRNTVLIMMANSGFITREKAREEMETPLELASMKGLEYGKAPFFIDYVYDNLVQQYGEAALDSLGMKVYTTLDYRLQKIAEEVLNKQLTVIQENYADHLRYRRPSGVSNAAAVRDSLARTQVQGALVALDVRTGAILAMVGGKNYDRHNQFNRATQAVRQPGSAFKPFVYTAALDNGWKISDTVIDSYFAMKLSNGQLWEPGNFDGTFSGTAMTLRDALKKSTNSVAAKLVNDTEIRSVGPATVAKYAQRMGITTPIPAVPSLALGAAGVKLLDITSAFMVFPNLGIRTEPFAIRTVMDKNNNQKLHIREGAKSEALRREVASLMITMLKTVNQSGTAAGVIARKGMSDRPSGGKTGTANDFKDAWYVGFTPYICCGVWVGFDSEESKLNRYYGTGSGAAAPVWVDFMMQASETMGYPKTDFNLASNLEAFKLCADTHLLATSACPRVYIEYYTRGAAPTRYCYRHAPGGNEFESGSRSFSQPSTGKRQNRGF
jgi:penicillin-binding protein 1A